MAFEIELQQAIYTALKSNTSLMSLVGNRLFDHVPQNTAYPFIKIGDDRHTANLSDDLDCSDVLITVDVWSQQKSHKEGKTILGEIYNTLHNQKIPNITYILWDASPQPILESDGKTTHFIIEFRANI